MESSAMNDLGTKQEGSPAPTPGPKSSGPEFGAATSVSYAHTLFLGPDGLRPGWGFAFYVIAFLALQVVAVDLAWAHDFGASGLWNSLLENVGSLVAAIIPSVVLARVEHRKWGVYGLPGRSAFGKTFWIGLLWGFGAVSFLIWALYGLHCYTFGHIVLHGARVLKFAAFWGLAFLLVGFFEEFLFRGYALFTFVRGVGFWPGAAMLSCAFGLVHLRNGGEQWEGLLAAGFIGLFFCLTLRRTGTLWFAVGFHAAWDWGETFFYSVPDSGLVSPGHLLNSSLGGPKWLSGGAAGPEGSILCLIVIAMTWIMFGKLYPRAATAPGS